MQTQEHDQLAPDALARFRRWAGIAVAIAALGYLAYALFKGFSETGEALVDFWWPIYIPVLGLTLVNYGLRYFKWHYLLGRLDIHVPHGANVWIYLCGLAMVISPAKAGEVVKPYLVKVVTGAPMARTIPALVTERVTDGLAVIILAAIGVSTYYAENAMLVYGTIGTIIAGIAVLSIEPLAHGVLRLLRALPVVGKVGDKLEELYRAMRTCVAPVPLLVTLAASLVAWFAECVGYWLVFMGVDAAVDLNLSTFLYAFSTTIGAPSPGGMGVSDVALVELAQRLAPDLTDAQALASSLLIRVATLWFGVLLGAAALLRIEPILDRYKTTES